jgi:hypothetical protein
MDVGYCRICQGKMSVDKDRDLLLLLAAMSYFNFGWLIWYPEAETRITAGKLGFVRLAFGNREEDSGGTNI